MKKIAIGCGIAALVVAALLVGAGVFGVRWVQNQMAEAERYDRITAEMEAEYGLPEAFVPPADGRYGDDRIDLFVEMRARLADEGSGLRERVDHTVALGEQRWWNELRTMLDLLNAGAGYLATADSLLLDARMSHGEYVHYQTVLLHAWFEESPDEFVDTSPEVAADTEFAQAFSQFVDQYTVEVRRLMQAHARNAREAAEAAGPGCEDCPGWIAYLEEQLEATRTRRAHVAFTDPAPPALVEAFEARDIELETTRPRDMGSWLLEILMAMDIEDEGQGVQFKIGE